MKMKCLEHHKKSKEKDSFIEQKTFGANHNTYHRSTVTGILDFWRKKAI